MGTVVIQNQGQSDFCLILSLDLIKQANKEGSIISGALDIYDSAGLIVQWGGEIGLLIFYTGRWDGLLMPNLCPGESDFGIEAYLTFVHK